MHTFLMTMAIVSSILLIVVVLLQESKSGGLSGLTGGAVVLGLIFFISLVCLTWLKL